MCNNQKHTSSRAIKYYQNHCMVYIMDSWPMWLWKQTFPRLKKTGRCRYCDIKLCTTWSQRIFCTKCKILFTLIYQFAISIPGNLCIERKCSLQKFRTKYWTKWFKTFWFGKVRYAFVSTNAASSQWCSCCMQLISYRCDINKSIAPNVIDLHRICEYSDAKQQFEYRHRKTQILG